MGFSFIIFRALKFIISTLLTNVLIIISIILVLIIIIIINIPIIFDTGRESTAANSLFNCNNTIAVKEVIPFKIFINFYISKRIILYFIVEFLNTFELIKFYVFNYFSEIVILGVYFYIFVYFYRNTVSYSGNLVVYLNRLVLRLFSKNSNRI